MNRHMKRDIKSHAENLGLSVHDFIVLRCSTPEDREMNFNVEKAKREMRRNMLGLK